MRSLARLLPWLALGPVTGPLACLAYNAARRGKWGLAVLCIGGIVAFYIGAPTLLALELHYLRSIT